MRAAAKLVTLALVLGLLATRPLAAASWVQVINLDADGEGLNDPTPFTPVGGNAATTLGAARLAAVEFALTVWANQLASDVTVVAAVQFDPLGGSSTSAVLALGGPTAIYRDFAGAPRPATWYASALADKLAGVELGPPAPAADITLFFNSSVDGAVLGGVSFYYGLDGTAPAGDLELVAVALHELAHGLGFHTVLDLPTGARFLGHDDAFSLSLEHHGATPADFPSMSDAQRQQAIVSGASLHWTGPAAVAAGSRLTAGVAAGGHLRMYGPSPATGSSVGHFDDSLVPDELMEPRYVATPLQLDLTQAVLQDIGWNAAPACSEVAIP